GGRLDATNVISPLACAVTNIARDHTEFLGDDLGGIAREKAGIFKPGVPCVTAESDPDVLEVLRRCASEAGAPLVALDDAVEVQRVDPSPDGTVSVGFRSGGWGERSLRVALPGPHQLRNALLAAELLALLPEAERPEWGAVEAGFAGVRWPGRLQVERIGSTTWVLDVAHNPAGVQALAGALDRMDLPRPWVLVVGILVDKEWREMLPPLVQRVDAAVLTLPPSAPPGRRWNPEAAAHWLRTSRGEAVRVIPDLSAALQRASTLAPHGTVIVAGSFHTVGDAMKELGVSTG
ncbi:MAG: bifunctional folylpolyglutamate synthase/dihydrofolate synthase, partial [Gemmatimonadetes bacterium]|nr:bifunctional folylpolyglutamate synthase/dihydrofolate synthase [Gemmatimonadota bacterium]